jgi:hypothetical protein
MRVWLAQKVKSYEEWSTHAYRLPLKKRMRHMEDFGSIDLMMKLCDAGGINQTLHRD